MKIGFRFKVALTHVANKRTLWGLMALLGMDHAVRNYELVEEKSDAQAD